MLNSTKQTVALSRIKRACDGAIKVAKQVDQGDGISAAQFDQIVTHLSEITEAVAVLGGEIAK